MWRNNLIKSNFYIILQHSHLISASVSFLALIVFSKVTTFLINVSNSFLWMNVITDLMWFYRSNIREACCETSSRSSVTYGVSDSVEKSCLITMVTTPPPSPRSREDLFIVSAPDSITCQSLGLDPPPPVCDWSEGWQPAQPSPPFSSSPPPPPSAPMWIMNDFPTVCHASHSSFMTLRKHSALWHVGEDETFSLS